MKSTDVSRRQFLATTAAGFSLVPRHGFGDTWVQTSSDPFVIHQHPQKATYTSPAEWPSLSVQSHWPVAGILSHTHVDMQFPLYAETARAPFTVPFSITLFNTDGVVNDLFGGGRLSGYTLDGGARLPLVGNPNGVTSWTGTATFNPDVGSFRGWLTYELVAQTLFANRERMLTRLRLKTYSVIDPTARESGDTPIFGQSNLFNTGGDNWGQQFVEFKQLLPILGPISPELPWTMRPAMYNYLPGVLGGKFSELRLDPNLHGGDPGITLASIQGPTGLVYSLPAGIPDGVHKLMWMWRRPNVAGTKDLTTNFVMSVAVGPGGVAQTVPGTVTPTPTPHD